MFLYLLVDVQSLVAFGDGWRGPDNPTMGCGYVRTGGTHRDGAEMGGGGGVEVILTIIKVVLSVPIMKFNLELNVVYVTVRTINSVIHRHAISIKVNGINMFRIVVSMAWLV